MTISMLPNYLDGPVL